MGRNLLKVRVHFVWATWDRLPLITPGVENRLYRYISAVCQDDGCDVSAINGMPDHVHLLTNLAGTICLAELMKHVKGGSSRFFSQTLMPGDWFAWQGSYSAFSVDEAGEERVISYIGHQKRHHAEGSLWPDAEQTQAPAGTHSLSAQADTRREAPPSGDFNR